jgi:hypothetical protein
VLSIERVVSHWDDSNLGIDAKSILEVFQYQRIHQASIGRDWGAYLSKLSVVMKL